MNYYDEGQEQYEEIAIQAIDNMPLGAVIEYSGNDVPVGWEKVNDYSTTEVDTGKTWIDGKPIYRTIFNAGSSSTTGQVNHNISNIDTITDFKSYMVDSMGTYYPLPWFNNMTEGNYFKASCTKTQIDKSANNTWGFTVWCIIEYTKTS